MWRPQAQYLRIAILPYSPISISIVFTPRALRGSPALASLPQGHRRVGWGERSHLMKHQGTGRDQSVGSFSLRSQGQVPDAHTFRWQHSVWAGTHIRPWEGRLPWWQFTFRYNRKNIQLNCNIQHPTNLFCYLPHYNAHNFSSTGSVTPGAGNGSSL